MQWEIKFSDHDYKKVINNLKVFIKMKENLVVDGLLWLIRNLSAMQLHVIIYSLITIIIFNYW